MVRDVGVSGGREQDAGTSLRALADEVRTLRERVQRLERENQDLEIALTTACEHGDAIETDLYAANERLRGEVRDRLIAERRLAELVEAVTRQKSDLEVLVHTITEHSDEIDTEWLRRYSQVEALSREDPLTGIANRRRLDEALAREWNRCARSASALSVAICDIDYFKKYNDCFGHAQGDAVLIAFARILEEACRRPSDLPARIGGEEFVVLIPETGPAGAVRLAQEVNRRLFDSAINHPGSPLGRVTVSIGVATAWPGAGGDPADLLAQADGLLYQAKRESRNTIRGDSADDATTARQEMP